MLQLRLLGVFSTSTAMYVVHELAAKGNIVENIPPQGMTETRCRRLAAGIVAGLQFIHRNNIVHRYSNRSNHHHYPVLELT